MRNFVSGRSGEFSKFGKWDVSLSLWLRIPHRFQSLEERGQRDLLKPLLGPESWLLTVIFYFTSAWKFAQNIGFLPRRNAHTCNLL